MGATCGPAFWGVSNHDLCQNSPFKSAISSLCNKASYPDYVDTKVKTHNK
jgi:hypothetical protein